MSILPDKQRPSSSKKDSSEAPAPKAAKKGPKKFNKEPTENAEGEGPKTALEKIQS